jgi:hypothetical protein
VPCESLISPSGHPCRPMASRVDAPILVIASATGNGSEGAWNEPALAGGMGGTVSAFSAAAVNG